MSSFWGQEGRSISREGGRQVEKGKTKVEYESNMSALASALVSRLDKGVSFEQSRQSGPREESMGQVVEIVFKLIDLSEQQIVNAVEFFLVNPDAVPIFLKMKERFRSKYICSVIP